VWDWWWHTALGVLGGVVLLWLVLLVVLWAESRRHPARAGLRELLRLLPDLVRLVSRLARDHTLPIRVRVCLWALLLYLASPIDLVPDFIPVLGYADDAIVVALALRFATRFAGRAAIDRHWPGSPEGLGTVLRFAGLVRAD
jgi:uncharacterized membrane protein YkvA (DUF1232 family)